MADSENCFGDFFKIEGATGGFSNVESLLATCLGLGLFNSCFTETVALAAAFFADSGRW